MELRQVEQALQQVEHDLAEHYREIAALRVERARLRGHKLELLINEPVPAGDIDNPCDQARLHTLPRKHC